MKKELLTIGELSKISGCSIKSLRYYDSIGVLKPIYVNPDTNYRYYSFEQVRMVELIQMCVMLSIPLKEIKDLIVKENNKVDCKDLIEYGRKITREKILTLNETLTYLDSLQDEIERIDSYDSNEYKEFYLNEKYYYTMIFNEDEMNDTYYKLLDTLFEDGFKKNISFTHDYGVIINIKDNIVTKYIACEVDKKHSNMENVIKIPDNNFLCKKTNEFNFDKICDMFSHINSSDKTIIISPGYSYDFSSPYFEVKCTLS